MYNERDPVTLEEMEEDSDDNVITDQIHPLIMAFTPQQVGFVTNLESPLAGTTPRQQVALDENPSDFLPGQQMATMFDKEVTTRVQFKGDSTVALLGDIDPYKNNLAVESTRWPALFVACGQQIEIFGTDGSPDLQGVFFAQPHETTHQMRRGANRPNSPHDINMLSLTVLCDKECLLASYDDGRTGLWVVGRILKEVRKDQGVQRYLPHLTLKSEASTWGTATDGNFLALSDNSRRVDIYDFSELVGKLGNKRYMDRVNIYNDEDVQLIELPRYRSPTLKNNIPSISINVCDDAFYITAGTIACEVATLKFFTGERLKRWKDKFSQMEIHPIPRSSSTDSIDSIVDSTDEAWEDSHIFRPFEGGLWIHRNSLGTHVWSVTTVHPQAFKKSSNLYEVNANKWANEQQIAAHFQRESSMATPVYNPEWPYYPAARFTHYDIPTCPFQSGGHRLGGQALTEMFLSMGNSSVGINCQPHYVLPQCKKETRKIKQWYERYGIERQENSPTAPTFGTDNTSKDNLTLPKNENEGSSPLLLTDPNDLYRHEIEREKQESPLKGLFLIVTTRRSLYLCRHDDLFVNGACPKVFSWEDIYGFGEQQFDRLCFAHYIPDLCIFICGSPIGAVSIFRLTQKAGIFCMRQEWAFPDTSQILFSADRLRLLAGVALAPLRTSTRENVLGSKENHWNEPSLRYCMTLIYCDGYQIKYEICGDEEKTWII